MNNNLNIDKMRFLLHKYYEAETTHDEELLLESLFLDTPEDEIPEDMADDAKLFSAIAGLHPSEADLEIPDDLFEKISEISKNPDTNHPIKIHRRLERRIVYALAVACVCILLALGMKWMTAPSDINSKPFEYASESPAEEPANPQVLPNEVKTQTTSPDPELTSKAHRPNRSNVMVENVDVSNELEDGFIEITDPEEAEKIVLEIGRLLATNSQKTNEAIRHLEKTVDEYKEITKSIIQ